jgi:hypothetical protein
MPKPGSLADQTPAPCPRRLRRLPPVAGRRLPPISALPDSHPHRLHRLRQVYRRRHPSLAGRSRPSPAVPDALLRARITPNRKAFPRFGIRSHPPPFAATLRQPLPIGLRLRCHHIPRARQPARPRIHSDRSPHHPHYGRSRLDSAPGPPSPRNHGLPAGALRPAPARGNPQDLRVAATGNSR